MGQRRTASGNLMFAEVEIASQEILGPVEHTGPFASIPSLIAIMVQVHIFLGLAEGALERAANYTRTKTRPWAGANIESAVEDSYLLQAYGRLWARCRSASALATAVNEELQVAWDQRWSLSETQRGHLAVSAAAAKTESIDAGLTTTNKVFELMGARSAASGLGFDRYWRDMRTLSLHDPVDYKLRDIGNWVLRSEFPAPGPYG